MSKDIIFDESCVFDKYIDNSPTDEEFAALHLPIEDITPRVLAPNEPVSFMDTPHRPLKTWPMQSKHHPAYQTVLHRWNYASHGSTWI